MITLGIPVLLYEVFNVPPEQAVLIAFFIAYLINFTSLRRLVFNSGRSIRQDFTKFALSTLGFRTAEYLLFLSLHSLLEVQYIIALFIVLLTSTIIKFFWYRRLFDTAPIADGPGR